MLDARLFMEPAKRIQENVESDAHDPSRRLAERAQAGDRFALVEIYEQYGGRLLALLRRTLRDGALAEDVFQDVWMKVMRNIESYDPEKGPFRSWLFRIASNSALDTIAHEARRRGPDVVEERTGGSSPSTPATKLDLEAALRLLPERNRVAVMLRHQQGLTYAELAQSLDVPVGTAKTLVHRGVVLLRGLME